ncbi:MAG: sugar ABC transporter permease [Provencibacterium sp.]|jgi:putative aldouronate transport system permease protein|nr:sugar ABC transporter permease [Provencibacterium sp.]
MTGQAVKPSAPINKQSFGYRLKKDFYRNKFKYLIILPVLIYLAIFCYKPMYGLVIAFKEYRPNLGIAGSPWVGFKQFTNFFKDPYFFRLIRNTFSISLLSLVFCFPAPIILALFINEIRNNVFKRTVQTITYMPYFISMVVACSLVKTYTQQNGLVSQIVMAFGGDAVNWLNKSQYFYPIYILSELWQTVGWNSIIYLAALTGIDQEQYEAARIDGASRMQQLWSITLPNLVPTIMILLILRMGGILNVGFEKIILLYNEGIYDVADVISSYVYRRGIINASYSYGAAIGLFNSAVNIVFLLVSNWISTRYTESGLF